MTACPVLYQVNTRVWLNELSQPLGRPATLDDVPDATLDRMADLGFDWIWFLSVWRTSLASLRQSRTHPELRKEFKETLPDLREEDIAGSGFAITGYTVAASLGGDAALVRLRQRLAQRGLKLMLDFIPNHTGLDHPWTYEHPEYYVAGTEADLAREPQNFTRVKGANVDLVLAHGRDPHFPGWSDTLQLDYSNSSTRQTMMEQLRIVAGRCDGVRCDMAMLVLPEVFERTWGRRPGAFWPEAIQQVRERHPEFLFLAEVYWDLEQRLQQQGFDYAYDKGLYDRLREGRALPVVEHLNAKLDYQAKLTRFLENHDEPRAAATFPLATHKAAAAITFFSPGMRLFHHGQLEGRRLRISPHLVRAPAERCDETLAAFYKDLLALLRLSQFRHGHWRLLECLPAWEGNWTMNEFVAFAWEMPGADPLLVTVNYASHQSQCCVRLPFPDLDGQTVRLSDLLGPARYDREGIDLATRGLYLDLPPWGYHLFSLSRSPSRAQATASVEVSPAPRHA